MLAGSSGYWQSWVSSCGLEDPAEIKTKRVRKQKTDRGGCPTHAEAAVGRSLSSSVGTGYGKSRSAATALHRHQLVQMRTRIMNQLQAVAMNEGYRWKKNCSANKDEHC